MKIKFNRDWLFKKENYDSFTLVNLPHDAMIYEKRDPNLADGRHTGYYPGGNYTYIKKIKYDETWVDKIIGVEFEGIYQKATVYMNNQAIYFRPYGYSRFFVDITNFLWIDQENELRVEVNNSETPNSRWYSGSGIYRDVFLHVRHKKSTRFDGVTIKTLSIYPAIISVKTDSVHDTFISVTILDKDKIIAKATGQDAHITLDQVNLWSSEHPYLYNCHVEVIDQNEVIEDIQIPFGIRLLEWIPKKGLFVNQKQVKLRGCAIHHDNGILGAVDLYDATYRKLKLLKNFGYNAIRSAHNPCSKHVLHACDELGLYVMDEAFDMWYLRKNRYDYGRYFEHWYEQDIISMVNKDKNHPCVIMYSSGNEVPETAQEKGIVYTKKMTDLFHQLDDTRPVTCGISIFMNMLVRQGKKIYTDWDQIDHDEKQDHETEGLSNEYHKSQGKSSSEKMNEMANLLIEFSQKAPALPEADQASTDAFNQLDIAGYNYATIRYAIDVKLHEDRLIVGTETTLRDYKINWKRTLDNDNVVGDFVWAGYQYLGEAGFGAFGYMVDGKYNKDSYPWLTNQTYSLNLIGDISEHGAYQQSIWGLRKKPFIAVKDLSVGEIVPIVNNWRLFDGRECWTWPGFEHHKTDVWVVSDSPYVQLKINDVVIETKSTDNHLAFFRGVTYVPGKIEAYSLDENQQVKANSLIETSSEPTHMHASIDKIELQDNGEDLAYIEVSILDDHHRLYPTNDCLIEVIIEGAIQLVGLGSANGLTEESFTSNKFHTYQGKVLLAIKATYEVGIGYVRLHSDQYPDVIIEFTVKNT